MERPYALTKVDVFQSVGPFVTHQIKHLEQLSVVQVLLGGHDVDHLVELVLVVSLSGTSNVSGDVDTGSVCKEGRHQPPPYYPAPPSDLARRRLTSLLDDDPSHLVLLQITQLGTLVLDQQPLFLHNLVSLFDSLGLDGSFTVVRVEMDVESLVSLFETFDGKVSESGPEAEGFLFACQGGVRERSVAGLLQ